MLNTIPFHYPEMCFENLGRASRCLPRATPDGRLTTDATVLRVFNVSFGDCTPFCGVPWTHDDLQRLCDHGSYALGQFDFRPGSQDLLGPRTEMQWVMLGYWIAGQWLADYDAQEDQRIPYSSGWAAPRKVVPVPSAWA